MEATRFEDVPLELEMQELETMEAPGWFSVIGVSAGITIGASVAYGSWAVSAAIVT